MLSRIRFFQIIRQLEVRRQLFNPLGWVEKFLKVHY